MGDESNCNSFKTYFLRIRRWHMSHMEGLRLKSWASKTAIMYGATESLLLKATTMNVKKSLIYESFCLRCPVFYWNITNSNNSENQHLMPGMGGDREGASNVKLLGMLVRKKWKWLFFYYNYLCKCTLEDSLTPNNGSVWVRPKSLICTPKWDDKHSFPFHMALGFDKETFKTFMKVINTWESL